MTETLVTEKQLPIVAHDSRVNNSHTDKHTDVTSKSNSDVQAPTTMLLGIGTAVPAHVTPQADTCNFACEVLKESATAAGAEAPLGLLKRVYAHSGIEKRHSVISDYTKTDPADFTFYPTNWSLDPFPTTADRMAEYEANAVELAAEAAEKAMEAAGVAPEEVTHLVISTCTGFFAPGSDVLLLRRLGMATTTARTMLGFMGCYAGVSGIRACHQIVQSDKNAVVLQVAVELCTLHFQRDLDPDIIVANAIFADGAAAAVYANEQTVYDVISGRTNPAAKVVAAHSDISADSLDRMSWRIGDHGFTMTLDAGIPAILREEVPAFVVALAAQGKIDPANITAWAVHPGGRKIVESIQQTLELSEDDVASSYDVLREYGNMSSATILFVLQRELERGLAPGTALAAMAFGPGLTMEGALLEVQ